MPQRTELPVLKVLWTNPEKEEIVVACDLGDIDGLEWNKIKELTDGLSPQLVMAQAAEFDFQALGALVWTFLKRDDSHINMNTVLRGLSISSIVVDEDDEESDEDPTQAEE